MWLTTITVGLVTLILIKWLNDYVKRWRMPPGPFFWPIIGNLSLFSGRMYLTFIDLAKTYGDVFSLKLGMTDVVVLNSLDAVKEAFMKKGADFAGRPKMLSMDISSEGGKDIVFTDYNPTWKLHRKLFHGAIRGYASGQNLQSKVHESLKDTIAEFTKMEGQGVNLDDYLYQLVYNVICSAAFGVRYNMDEENFKTLMKVSKDAAERFGQGFLADVYPLLRFLPSPTVTACRKMMDQILGIMQCHLEQHKETFDPSNLRDITDHMIKAQKDAEEEGIQDINSLTDTHLRQTISDIFFGGTFSSIFSLRWALLYLAVHPEIQEKVAAELDSVVGRDRLPELSDREATPYMEATMHEVMRMASMDPLSLPHATTVDTTLRGYQIPKGTMVMPNLWALHHDPDTWGDPDVFRPERFLDENGKPVKPAALMPFSAGRRACPGETLGKANNFLLLGGLVQNFRFSISKGEGPPDLTPDEKGGGASCIPSPYKVVMTCRK
ncbi:steroid 17-alpha-hydroxylase/17,20 lyase-like [Branchiostoma floridae]|uniref:Steroid 17-alpha-hydroxylase/17,20 lyase-like n=1 Tax=Branchiostoma floridae TaxID=7739 RepID=A0A9J7N292_BRAFL|nr:steroid 17-alpha-hydroxylase/17,20 lyase-like [Branchiostoma floridae]